jgi:hypothetical protein
VPRLAGLDDWANHWVAIKNGNIIAVSETSHDLAYKLRTMGPRAAGAVTEFVRPGSDDTYAIGVG